MLHCGGSTGIFLRIRDCQIILLTANKRGCLRPAPYVDEFGETDQGFKRVLLRAALLFLHKNCRVCRRGNPLHLNHELYRRYQRLWLYQGIADEVQNQYEMNTRMAAYDWVNF